MKTGLNNSLLIIVFHLKLETVRIIVQQNAGKMKLCVQDIRNMMVANHQIFVPLAVSIFNYDFFKNLNNDIFFSRILSC